MYSSLLRLLFIVALCGVIAPSALAQSTPLPSDDEAPLEDTSELAEIDFVFDEAPEDHAIGDVSAPLTMITYASVTCGHCGNWFSNEWPSIQDALVKTGKLRFVLRPLPTPPAVLSMTGFLIGECASDEAYFDVIQYQMENQQAIFEAAQNGQGQEAYAKVAALADLNTEEEINSCLSNPDMMAQLRQSGVRAEAADVQGVPAFYVNGTLYKGKQDAPTIIALIEDMTEKGLSELPEIKINDTHDHTHKDHEHEGD